MPRREPPLLVLHLFDISGSKELGRFSHPGAGAHRRVAAFPLLSPRDRWSAVRDRRFCSLHGNPGLWKAVRIVLLQEADESFAHAAAEIPVQTRVRGTDQRAELYCPIARLGHFENADSLVPFGRL